MTHPRLQQLKNLLTPAILAALLCLLACTLLLQAQHSNRSLLLQNQQQQFGQLLARQVAREASHSLIQNDHLSLQTLLNQLVGEERVSYAIIYDVENRAIAEAGQRQAAAEYSASITFQDSIAGYAVIALHDPAAATLFSTNTLFVLLSLLLSAVVYVVMLWREEPGSGQRGEPSPGRAVLREERGGLPSQAVLELNIDNYEQQKRHNEQQLIDHCESCYELLQTVSRLYDGQLSIRRAGSYCLEFAAHESEADQTFRAACCAQLALPLLAELCPALQFSAGLSVDEQRQSESCYRLFCRETALERAHSAACAMPGQLMATEAAYFHGGLQERVDGEHLPALEAVVIRALDAPYTQLLDSQLARLRAQFVAANSDAAAVVAAAASRD